MKFLGKPPILPRPTHCKKNEKKFLSYLHFISFIARYREKQTKLDIEKTNEETSIINKPFMKNAIFTCHNIQECY